MSQLTGQRLDAILTLLELLLPFGQDAYLGLREVAGRKGQPTVPGPAHYIEQWIDGILREVMADGRDGLTVPILEQAWRDIKRAKVVNFLDYLRAKQGTIYE